jgi:hypothetical protein
MEDGEWRESPFYHLAEALESYHPKLAVLPIPNKLDISNSIELDMSNSRNLAKNCPKSRFLAILGGYPKTPIFAPKPLKRGYISNILIEILSPIGP